MSDFTVTSTALNALKVVHDCPTNLEVIAHGGDRVAFKCHTCGRVQFSGGVKPEPLLINTLTLEPKPQQATQAGVEAQAVVVAAIALVEAETHASDFVGSGYLAFEDAIKRLIYYVKAYKAAQSKREDANNAE